MQLSTSRLAIVCVWVRSNTRRRVCVCVVCVSCVIEGANIDCAKRRRRRTALFPLTHHLRAALFLSLCWVTTSLPCGCERVIQHLFIISFIKCMYSWNECGRHSGCRCMYDESLLYWKAIHKVSSRHERGIVARLNHFFLDWGKIVNVAMSKT